MVESNHIKNFLSKAFCSKCGISLDTAKLTPLGEMPLAVIAHATCLNCKSENMITITSFGTGVFPLVSDLSISEIKKFMYAEPITHKDVLKLHTKLKRNSLWNLSQKKEQN